MRHTNETISTFYTARPPTDSAKYDTLSYPSASIWLEVSGNSFNSSWQDSNWRSASRGPSAIALLLVDNIVQTEEQNTRQRAIKIHEDKV